MAVERVLGTIEGDDLLSFSGTAHDYFSSGDLVSIEGVQRLADLEEDEVGDIHNVVYRMKSDGEKLLLEPFRRRTHFHVLNGNSLILRSSVSIQHFYRDSTFTLSFLECRNIRIREFARDIIQSEISIQVSGYTDM